MTTVYLAITETEKSNYLIKLCDSLDAELKRVVCGPIEVKISEENKDELVRICHNGKRGKPASHQLFSTFMDVKRELKSILRPEDCELIVQKRKIQEIIDDETEFSESDSEVTTSKVTTSKVTTSKTNHPKRIMKQVKPNFKQDVIKRIKEVCEGDNRVPFQNIDDIGLLPFYSVYQHDFIPQLIAVYPSRIKIPSLKFVGSFLLFQNNFEEFKSFMKECFQILKDEEGMQYFALEQKDLQQLTNPHYSLESVQTLFIEEISKIIRSSCQMSD